MAEQRVDPGTVYRALVSAGLEPVAAAALTSIAKRESGFKVTAHNPDSGTQDDSLGLWQINLYKGGWTNFLVQNLGWDASKVRSYLTTFEGSVQAVAAIYKNSGMNPWGPYKGVPWDVNVDHNVGVAASGGQVTLEQSRSFQGAGHGGTTLTGGSTGTGGDTAPADGSANMAGDSNVDYSQYAWLIDDPEVGPLIRDAESGARFQGENGQAAFTLALQQTKWWREHSASSRAWEEQVNTDPASAKDRVAQEVTTIKKAAAALGIELPELALLGYADQMIRYSWSPDQLNAALMAGVKLTGNDKGKAGLGEQQIRSMAEDYGIRLSDRAVADYQTKVMSGLLDQETLQGDFAARAQTMFPSVADSIKRGHTVRQILDPYLDSASQILGKDAAAMFNVSDPKWLRPIQDRDPQGGKLSQMSMADWNAMVMKDTRYGYDQTTNARNDAFALSQALMSTFGSRA